MLKGIEQAAAFILFLSSGVLIRPYCQMEIRHAVALNKPIVMVHEVGGVPFVVSLNGLTCLPQRIDVSPSTD